ncbi:aspartate/glutamate racemase family protein [Streptosporangium sp. DT93]|uniref:aspartate/glutamate racemase family protein n=1 Tax=Streptosporangium sp. DT93 TaxID=3393428 RepID=UPI003CED45A6
MKAETEPKTETEPDTETRTGPESRAESRAESRVGKGHDVAVGVICMDTSFTKIPGHIRNPATFGFPVLYRVVEGATAERVVTQADPALLGPFVDAARDLQARGAAAVTSGCGFLAIFQRELADAVTVPLYSSSLIQVPMVARMIRSDQKVGLLVAKERSLTRRHLAGVGAEDVPVCVAGMEEQPEFREVMLEARRPDLDAARLGREVLAQAERLARENPDMGALVIECTDLVPYAHAVQERIGLPVFDIVTLTEMVHHGLTRTPYGAR